MALFKSQEWSFSEKAVQLATTNPFDPCWSEKGRKILGLPLRNAAEAVAWRPGANLWGPQSIYSAELRQQIIELVERVRQRLLNGCTASEEELRRLELLAVYDLYCKYGELLDRHIDASVRRHHTRERDRQPAAELKPLYEEFVRDHSALFRLKNYSLPLASTREHLFACFFLLRRAFYHIFFNIVGSSRPMALLRCRAWESIVTHDLLGWMGGLHERMKEIPTLITGPSGTGKERVAEAIGRSLYIPYEPAKRGFAVDFVKAFNPVNLSALPPLLIEAELFGHVKGSFAGAVRDRIGRLEECPEEGAVFLDEVGELTPEIQVKLLRVLQARRFQRVGANDDRQFKGKIIAATNRDLDTETQAGRFRDDLYYRLCADRIRTPSLREQLDDCPEDLPVMVAFVCRSVVGEEKADALAREVVGWIEANLERYAWPGNFRELEQCVRSYTVRKAYVPVQAQRPDPDSGTTQPLGDPVAQACEELAGAVLDEKITFAEIRERLFTLVRHGTPTAKEAARRLGLRDYRTVKARVK
jgi:transcriptional regulator with AAA-type ATPase domain